MHLTTFRRAARRFSLTGLGLAAVIGLTTSVGNAQSTIQLTDWSGNVYPAHAHLYTTFKSCHNPHPLVTVCDWYIRKLYGDNSAVVVTVHAPNGSDPACSAGTTVHIVSGYTRSGCGIFVTTAAYGN